MSYKIIIDSCGELPQELKDDGHFASVALELEVDNYRIVDDATFDQADFLRRVKESPTGPKSSCPSPDAYMKEFEGDAEHIYVVTLSGELSGSYNSAVLAKNLYEEDNDDKKIYVFNSKSASIGETLIGMKAQELEEEGKSFEDVISGTEEYIAKMRTFFVLESLETLRKAGRLSNLKSAVANVLNIKPVMASTDEGSICQLGQARGMKKAVDDMVSAIIEQAHIYQNKILGIAHCNCPERAEAIKKKVEELGIFSKIVIVDTAGISSMYANDGGVIAVI